jgi:ABC-type taurine transport system ATPase subunit
LTKLNLVERDDGTRYHVTKLGKAVYIAITLIEDALVIKGKLDIIDSLDARKVPSAERNTIIKRLVDNQNIRSILMKKDF